MDGYEGSISLVYDVANHPVLQDTSADQVMANWSASQRDFVILDGDNVEVDRYNLTMTTLEVEENRETVRAALIAAAEALE